VRKRCPPELANRFTSITFDAFTKSLVDRFHSAIPTEWRPDRPYDIAFPVYRQVVGFLDLSRLAAPPQWQPEIAGLAAGNFESSFVGAYPNSQNRRVDSTAKKITPRRGRYVSNTADRPELLKKLKISGEHHLIIDHRKYSKDDGGNRVSSYALSGFSGGAVIDFGKLSTPEVSTGIVPCEPRLAGLFIEYYKDHQAIVATRVDTILKAYVAKQNQRKPGNGRPRQ
jgi:hypothetical protein